MRRTGFTLVEVLATVTIMAVIAGLVIPRFSGIVDRSLPAVMSATVKQVREHIEYHAAASVDGYPWEVDPRWFVTGRMPDHVWTDRWLVVEVVDGFADERCPEFITFDLDDGPSTPRTTGPTAPSACWSPRPATRRPTRPCSWRSTSRAVSTWKTPETRATKTMTTTTTMTMTIEC